MKELENNIQERALLDDERISRFMQGRMDADDAAAFLKELKSNEELRNSAIAQARLVKGMRQVDEELKEALRQSDEQTIRRVAANVVGRKKNPTRWLAIAASLIFIIFVGLKSYDYYNVTSLGREYAKSFPMSTIIRGEADTEVDSELATLFNNVAEGKDLDNTTSRLATLWELAKQDTYNDHTDYAPYIGWNLAIGYLENYEKDKAKEVLMEMKEMYPAETIIGDKVIMLLGSL